MVLILSACLYRVSADGESVANMTNLGIKGIIGVRAMAEISRAMGEGVDTSSYGVRFSPLMVSQLDATTAAESRCRHGKHMGVALNDFPRE